MLSLRNISAGLLFGALLASAQGASAGLYGFDTANPYTQEENNLRMDYLPDTIPNYRAEMRNNLLMLIDYAHKQNPNFQVLSHEGQELLYKSRWEYELEGYNSVREKKQGVADPVFLFNKNLGNQEPAPGTNEYRYLNAVNAVVLNNFYCGTGAEKNTTFNHNIGHISIEQCSDEGKLDEAVARSLLDSKIVYAFTERNKAFRDLTSQPIINDNARIIENVNDAKNISLLLNDRDYASAADVVSNIARSNFDIVVIDPLFQGHTPFSSDDIRQMQFKKNGAKRLLIAAFNVSEASPQDYFWNKHWHKSSPSWLVRESFVTPNAFITRYWSEDWRQILSRHFKDIVQSGYDGIFFTGLENNDYFEHQTPLE